MTGGIDPILNDICSLEIVQQPVRARMCGFGDKVRRCGVRLLRYWIMALHCILRLEQ